MVFVEGTLSRFSHLDVAAPGVSTLFHGSQFF